MPYIHVSLLLLSPSLPPAPALRQPYARCVCAMKPMRRAGGFQVSTLVGHKSIHPPLAFILLSFPLRLSTGSRRYQEINRHFSFAFYVITWSREACSALSATSQTSKCVSNLTSGVSPASMGKSLRRSGRMSCWNFPYSPVLRKERSQ